jgi:uncharacterized coiled-coil protein SlyX
MCWPVVQDWRDERIAELEAPLAARGSRIAELEQRIAELRQQVAELLEKLGQNSRNSHRPPSSDSPAARGQRRGKGKSKSLRKRWAQPGHRPAQRQLIPPDEVDEVVDLFPTHSEDCVPSAHVHDVDASPGYRDLSGKPGQRGWPFRALVLGPRAPTAARRDPGQRR